MPANFNEQRAQFTPRVSNESLRSQEGSVVIRSRHQSALIDHEKSLSEALDIYQKNNEDKAIVGFKIRDKHTWDEVFREASFAEAQYKGASKVRQVFRSIGDNATLVDPWLELIPDGDYLSPVRGGLKLIFKVVYLICVLWVLHY